MNTPEDLANMEKALRKIVDRATYALAYKPSDESERGDYIREVLLGIYATAELAGIRQIPV